MILYIEQEQDSVHGSTADVLGLFSKRQVAKWNIEENPCNNRYGSHYITVELSSLEDLDLFLTDILGDLWCAELSQGIYFDQPSGKSEWRSDCMHLMLNEDFIVESEEKAKDYDLCYKR